MQDRSLKDPKSILLERLEKYTSVWNKFIAWIKWIFSFGYFGLGLRKQKSAERLKAELRGLKEDAQLDTSRINSYAGFNALCVSEEWEKSSLFKSEYVAKKSNVDPSGNNPSFSSTLKVLNNNTKEEEWITVDLNAGELGKILEEYKAPSLQ